MRQMEKIASSDVDAIVLREDDVSEDEFYELAWKVQEIAAVPTTAFHTPAQRPLNSRLDNRKLQMVMGLSMPIWQCGVDRMLQEILGRG